MSLNVKNRLEIVSLYDGYPEVVSIQESGSLFISSPTGNCQNFCINNTIELTNLSESDLKKIFSDLYIRWGKTLFIIDIKDERRDYIFNTFNFLILKHLEMPYTSTNGSHMILCLIYIDIDALDIPDSFSFEL